jgi:hypothetical protein
LDGEGDGVWIPWGTALAIIDWDEDATENVTAKQHRIQYSNLLEGIKVTSLLDVGLIVAADDGS